MNDLPKNSLLERMQENQRIVVLWMERMMAEASEFAEMLQGSHASTLWDRKKSRDDDWNVDNR